MEPAAQKMEMQKYSLKTKLTLEKSPFLTGDTSSNGWFSIVIRSFSQV